MALLSAAGLFSLALAGAWALRWEAVITAGMFFIAQMFWDGGEKISKPTGVSHGNGAKILFWAVAAVIVIAGVLGGIYVFPRAAKQMMDLYKIFLEYLRANLPPDLYESLKEWDVEIIAQQLEEWDLFVKGKRLLENNPETMGAVSAAVAKAVHIVMALPKEFLHMVLLFVGAYYVMERENPWRAEDAYAIHPPAARSGPALALAVVLDAYKTLKSFVLGQVIVCLSASLFYWVGLKLIGVKSALALGLFAGGVSFIPIIGTFLGFVSITVTTYVQSQDLLMVLLVAALFQTGHFIEAKIMIPKVVGARVGLSPLAALLALLVGMKFGIIGMAISVPVAGMARVAALHLRPEAEAAWGAYVSYLKSLFEKPA